MLGGENFTLDAVSDKNLPLTYEVISGESVSVNENGNVAISQTGTTAIKVSSSDPNYENANLNVTVVVGNKALDISDFGEIKASGIVYEQFLADSKLTGNKPVDGEFVWTDTNIKPAVSDSEKTEYDVKFVPADTEIYDVVEGLKSILKVDKALTEITGTDRYEKLIGD